METYQLGLRSDGKKFNFFIIDDCSYITYTLSNLFECFGGKISGTATDALEAISKLKECYQSVDIITLDIRLNKVDGRSVLKEIKNICPKVKVIMISANATQSVIQNCILLGANHFLAKPLQKDEIFKTVKKICDEINKTDKTEVRLFKQLNLLIIDQTAELLNFIKNNHETFRCKVLEKMKDLKATINKINNHPVVDLIMINLPELGNEDLDKINQIHKIKPFAKIILITDSKNPILAMKALTQGVYGYIDKQLSDKLFYEELINHFFKIYQEARISV
ncbi:MAG: response regulator [Candidatus Margulisbacteria bacterium]|nr:response regulator [Candidatus Margulisiibacteriota bacterium]